MKRTKRRVTCSWRPRTDEDRSDSGSEPEARPETPNYYVHAREAQLANSPDSGYGGSRANTSPQTIVSVSDNVTRCLSSSPAWSTSSSPLCVVSSSRFDSPFHLATFGSLTMSSPFRAQIPVGVDTVTTSPSVSVTTPVSPASNKKRTSDVFQTTNVDHQKTGNRKSPKKPKAARKINFEAIDNTSPVLGTIIRDVAAAAEDGVNADGLHMRSGDIDPSLNVVDVSPEARAELERIENIIGDYVCRLCRGRYDDAFRLAQHRCSCIVHVEYRCPECDKAFNCPANLASHRRWHKPRVSDNVTNNNNNNSDIKNNNDYNNKSELKTESEPEIKQLKYPIFTAGSDLGTLAKADGSPTSAIHPGTPASPGEVAQYPCNQCAKTFRRHAYLRKHVASCHATRYSSAFVGGDAARMDHTTPSVCACNVCGRTFADPAVRDAHVRLHAVSQSLGGARYPELLQLQRRLEAALADRQPTLSCKLCDDSFHSKQTLARHMDKCHVSNSRQLLNVPRPPPIVDRTC